MVDLLIVFKMYECELGETIDLGVHITVLDLDVRFINVLDVVFGMDMEDTEVSARQVFRNFHLDDDGHIFFWNVARFFTRELAGTMDGATPETIKIDAIKILSRQLEYAEENMVIIEAALDG